MTSEELIAAMKIEADRVEGLIRAARDRLCEDLICSYLRGTPGSAARDASTLEVFMRELAETVWKCVKGEPRVAGREPGN